MGKLLKQAVRLTVLFILLGFSNGIYAQKAITGVVKDAANGGTLPGVNVTVKEKAGVGTVTDIDGKFSLKLPEGAKTLVFSFIGYTSQDVTIAGKASFEIQLQADSRKLDEVVVTALGVKKADKRVGYAMTQLKTEEISRVSSVSPIGALQGKVAGVNINLVGSSGVQSSPSILIRGAKSLSKNNQPIFVIDGMVIENNTADLQGVDWGSQLKNLNPDDYESVTVLKGAAATAIYGSRGANGAVVITTKSGKARKGIGVEFGHSYQYNHVYANHFRMQNIYGMGDWSLNEGAFNADGNPEAAQESFGPKMEGQMIKSPYSADKVPYSPQPDNWKIFYQDGHYINTNVALSGGTTAHAFRVSYSNTDNKGTLPGNEFNRNSLSIKSNGKINDIFSFDYGFSYANSTIKNPGSQGRWNDGSNYGRILSYSIPRSMDLYHFRNNMRNPDKSIRTADWAISEWGTLANIFHYMDYRDEQRNEESYLANLTLTAKANSWLDFSAKVNYNLYKNFTERKVWGTGAYLAGGEYKLSGGQNSNYNMLFMAHANRKLNEDFELDVRLGNEMYGSLRNESWSKATRDGLVIPGLFTFGNSVNPDIIPEYNHTPANEKSIGLFAIANISWRNQVNLELTGRNDWLSTLLYPSVIPWGKNNYSVFYPSANLSWVFTDTFKGVIPQEILSFGKLRASLARVGLGTRPYETNTLGFVQGSIYNPDGSKVTTATESKPGVLPNYDIKPEIQQTIELGTDLKFFNNRFGVDFAWYRANTYNQILTIPGVLESGATQRMINAGNIQNTGIELAFNIKPIKTNDLNWDMNINFTRNRGKVVKLHGEVKEYQLMGNYEGVEVWAYEGGEFGVMTSTSVQGKYQARDAQGNPIADPRNGKYVLRNSGYEFNGDTWWLYSTDARLKNYNSEVKRTKIGNIQPDFLFGFTNNISYKSLDLAVMIDGRVGGIMYSGSYNQAMGMGIAYSSLKYRDKEHGGLPRKNSNGEIVYNGVIPDAIFADGTTVKSLATGQKVDISGMSYKEAVDAGHLQPMAAGMYYGGAYGWARNTNQSTMENTWVMLREITLGYNLPTELTKKIRLNNVRVYFSARNVGYIYNGLKDKLNPESITSNNPFAPVESSASPYARSFAVGVNVSL
jgi:iron complex outermembrane receptor protein